MRQLSITIAAIVFSALLLSSPAYSAAKDYTMEGIVDFSAASARDLHSIGLDPAQPVDEVFVVLRMTIDEAASDQNPDKSIGQYVWDTAQLSIAQSRLSAAQTVAPVFGSLYVIDDSMVGVPPIPIDIITIGLEGKPDGQLPFQASTITLIFNDSTSFQTDALITSEDQLKYLNATAVRFFFPSGTLVTGIINLGRGYPMTIEEH